eukprot:TRINITY_DN3576_c0_g3_i2.p1 TRINITY_DN3576_c0_g3~~TRINITY_DN3576_c0_g3_i2.p1  ORF type:complete len:1067 (+),score=192.43 TRINITY_DN3576_c0_g3_i2:122-3322(+)
MPRHSLSFMAFAGASDAAGEDDLASQASQDRSGPFAVLKAAKSWKGMVPRRPTGGQGRNAVWIPNTEERMAMVDVLRSLKKTCLIANVRVRDVPAQSPVVSRRRRSRQFSDASVGSAHSDNSAEGGSPSPLLGATPGSPSRIYARRRLSGGSAAGCEQRRETLGAVSPSEVALAPGRRRSSLKDLQSIVVPVDKHVISPLSPDTFGTGLWGGSSPGPATPRGDRPATPRASISNIASDTRYGGLSVEQVVAGVAGGRFQQRGSLEGHTDAPLTPRTPGSPAPPSPADRAGDHHLERVISHPVRTCAASILFVLSREHISKVLQRAQEILAEQFRDATTGRIASPVHAAGVLPKGANRRGGAGVATLVTWAEDCRIGAVSPATRRMFYAIFSPAVSDLTLKTFALFVLSVADDVQPKAFTRAPDKVVESIIAESIRPWLAEMEVLSSPELGYTPTWLRDIPELDDFMYQREEVLRVIFSHFRSLTLPSSTEGSADSNGNVMYSDDGDQYTEAMVLSDIFRLSEVGGWYPNTVSRVTLSHIVDATSAGFPRSHALKRTMPYPCLLFPEFCDAVVFLACALFSSDAQAVSAGYAGDESLTAVQKVQAFFTCYLSDMYTRLTGLPMEVDVHTKILRQPQIRSAAPNVGVAGEIVVISGMNFCKKRGVHVSFGDRAVRCHALHDDYVICRAPPLSPAEEHNGALAARHVTRPGMTFVELSLETRKRLEVRNNRVWVKLPKSCEDFMYKRVLFCVPLGQEGEDALKRVHTAYSRDKPLLPYAQWRALATACGMKAVQSVFQRCASLRKLVGGGDALIQGTTLYATLCSLLVLRAEEARRERGGITASLVDAVKERLVALSAQLDEAAVALLDDLQDEWMVDLRAELELIPTIPPPDAVDVLLGPQHVGVLRQRARPARVEFHGAADDTAARAAGINRVIAPCESLQPALRKLLAYGYQSRPRVRGAADAPRFISRCWEVLRGDQLMGHLWDTPGTGVTADGWIPADDGSFARDELSVHLSCLTRDSPHFLQILHAYRTKRTLVAFREHLMQLGYNLLTVLPGTPTPRPLHPV